MDSAFQLLGKDISQDRLSFSDHGVEVNIQARWITSNPSENDDAIRHDCITLIETNEERIPDSISRYLEQHDIIVKDMLRSNKNASQNPSIQRYKIPGENVITLSALDHKIRMRELFTAMDYHYSENTSITFPYGGIQIQAVSNIISAPNGKEVIVDFGELYGDAIHIIEKTGMTIIQVKPEDDFFPSFHGFSMPWEWVLRMTPLFLRPRDRLRIMPPSPYPDFWWTIQTPEKSPRCLPVSPFLTTLYNSYRSKV